MVSTRAELETTARGYGFGRIRYTTPELAHPERLTDAIAEGRHGSMDWLARTVGTRLDPRQLLRSVRTVVVLGMDYGQVLPPDPGGLTGRVASYAWGRDYHNLVLRRLRKLRRHLQNTIPGLVGWCGVDSQPVWERAWAEASGVGYAGRNGMIIAPGDTSCFFLGILLLNEALPPDPPLGDHCGACRRCISACPTGALRGDGAVDARLCISYLTIEHDGVLDPALRPQLGRWLFGCDDCQDVCPHVSRRPGAIEADFAARNAWIDLPGLLASSDEALKERFTGTPLRRAAPRRLRRNAAYVLGNLGDRAARPALIAARAHPDPWTADAAEWALERIG